MPAAPKKPRDPFKVRKQKAPTNAVQDTITPPADVKEAIDSFRECQEQAKHYEGEATIYKDKILNFAKTEYLKRMQAGMTGTFKLMGDEGMISYIVQDSSAGLTDDDVEEFRERWGDEAAEELITKDYASVRFDGKVFEANYDKIVEALQTLPDEVLENLFKPHLLKAQQNALMKAQKYAKTPEELREILEQLRIKNYVK